MYVPDGFVVVTPYLMVEGADAYVRFLVAAFGAHETGRSVDPDGRIANCQVRFAATTGMHPTTTIMVSEASAAFPASVAAFCLYIEDADAAMAAAEAAGARRIMDVANMPYGDRQGGVRDPAGNVWWLSQRLTAEPYFPAAGQG